MMGRKGKRGERGRCTYYDGGVPLFRFAVVVVIDGAEDGVACLGERR